MAEVEGKESVPIQEILGEALGVQERIGALHASLAASLGPDPSEETELKALMSKRESLIRQLGLANLKWAMAGGDVLLVDGAGSENRVTPLPAVSYRTSPEVPVYHHHRRREERPVLETPRYSGPKMSGPEAVVFLRKMLDRIGPPKEVLTSAEYSMEVHRVGSGADAMDDWLPLDQHIQRDLLAMLVSKARYLQDETDPAVHAHHAAEKLRRIFPRLTAWSRLERPGYVHGLTRRHAPEPAATWLASCAHWHRLLARTAGISDEAEEEIEQANRHALDTLRSTLKDSPRAAELCKAFVDCVLAGVPSDDDELVGLAEPHLSTLMSDPRLADLRRSIQAAEQSAVALDEVELSLG